MPKNVTAALPMLSIWKEKYEQKKTLNVCRLYLQTSDNNSKLSKARQTKASPDH